MPKGETPAINQRPEIAPGQDNTEKIESAYNKGAKPDAKGDRLDFSEFGTTHYAGKVLEMKARLERIQKKNRDERMTEKVRRAIKEMNDAPIEGVLINDTPPPLPRTQTDTQIPPADTKLAALAARTDATQKPAGMWGKFKSWLSGESDYKKFGKMAEGPVQTPVAPELEPIGTAKERAQGEAMMTKQEKAEAVAKAKEAEWLRKESIKDAAKYNKPAMSDEEEELMFRPNLINRVATAAEEAIVAHQADNIMAESLKSKTQKKIDARVAKEKAKSDKMVADYENKFNKNTAKKQKGETLLKQQQEKDAQELENWELDKNSPMKPAGEDYAEKIVKGGPAKRFVNEGIDKLSAYQDRLAEKSLTNKLDNPTAILRGESKLTREAQVMDEKGKKLERDLLLKQFANETADLRKTIESVKIGWFSHLKIGPDGKFKNLPGGTTEMVMNFLIAEKDRLGNRDDVNGANKKVEQLEALEKYEEKLKGLEKTLSEIK